MEIKRQIIQGTSSVRLRRKAIEQNLNLENLLKAARAMETADEQTSEIEKQQSHAVGFGGKRISDGRRKESSNGRPKSGCHNNKCGLCGGKYPHQGNCPAQGKQCLNCGKMNHFSKVCRSKPNNRSKSTRPRKPLKINHRARSVDIEDPSWGETPTLAGADDDNSDEYTFHIGMQ